MRRYLAERAERVASSTTARELNAIRSLFTALLAHGLVERDPTEGLDVEVGPPRMKAVLPPVTVAAYLDAALVGPEVRRSPEVKRALALRNRAVLELLYGTGLRASEVASARVTDLDLAGASVLCRRAKRGQPATVPLPASAVPQPRRLPARRAALPRPRGPRRRGAAVPLRSAGGPSTGTRS